MGWEGKVMMGLIDDGNVCWEWGWLLLCVDLMGCYECFRIGCCWVEIGWVKVGWEDLLRWVGWSGGFWCCGVWILKVVEVEVFIFW